MSHSTLVLPSVAIGGLSSGSFLLAQVGAHATVPLGEAAAGFVFLSGLVWYVARKIQSVEDCQRETTRSLELLADDMRDVKQDLARRPCQIDGVNCPTKKK